MYQEIVYRNTENSTIFNFKSESTWQEAPTAQAHKDSWDMTVMMASNYAIVSIKWK